MGWGAEGISVYCSMGIIVWAFGVRVFVCCRESESEIELFWAPVYQCSVLVSLCVTVV